MFRHPGRTSLPEHLLSAPPGVILMHVVFVQRLVLILPGFDICSYIYLSVSVFQFIFFLTPAVLLLTFLCWVRRSLYTNMFHWLRTIANAGVLGDQERNVNKHRHHRSNSVVRLVFVDCLCTKSFLYSSEEAAEFSQSLKFRKVVGILKFHFPTVSLFIEVPNHVEIESF